MFVFFASSIKKNNVIQHYSCQIKLFCKFAMPIYLHAWAYCILLRHFIDPSMDDFYNKINFYNYTYFQLPIWEFQGSWAQNVTELLRLNQNYISFEIQTTFPALICWYTEKVSRDIVWTSYINIVSGYLQARPIFKGPILYTTIFLLYHPIPIRIP